VSLATTSPTAGPALSVDPTQNRHAISPYIYGVNYDFPVPSQLQTLRTPVRRWGGDGTTEYNWQLDKSNTAADWYFEVFAQSGTNVFDPVTYNHSAFDRYYETNQQYGTKTFATVPIQGWVAGNFVDKTCSYSVKKYGAQQSTDQYATDCGNGKTTSGAAILTNNPRDTDVQENAAMMTQWVQHAVARYGTAAQGGVMNWALDNEPVWWSGVHQNVHPLSSTYDEVTNDGLEYAAAIKAADPTATVSGPVTAGWDDLFFSSKDFAAGYGTPSPVPGGENWKPWNNPVDQNAHGGLPFIAYYLQQFANYEKQHGQRILDYLEVHGYVPGAGITGTNAASNAMRMRSSRIFWDPNFILYTDPAFVVDSDDYLLNANPQWKTPQCVCLIPRMKQWVNTYYPGTKTAITEYNVGLLNPSSTPLATADLPTYLNGALAQADLLGIFGREGLDLATMWANMTVGDPVSFSFQIFLNYDGIGGAFGDTSILGTSGNEDQLPIYAAQRSDSTLTLLVINKTGGDLSSTVALNNFTAAGTVQQWSYSPANLTAIVQGPNLTTTSNGIPAVFPANSITLLVVPAATTAPQPVVNNVVNLASHGAAIAPGTIVEISGTNLGPASTEVANPSAADGVVKTQLSTVKVWFEGYPAPVYSAAATAIVAAVPYATSSLTTVHVVVESQGVRSAAVAVPLAVTAPAIYTLNGAGTGAALALAYSAGNLFPALNSATNPATAGSNVQLFVTGAGVMNPAASDGRLGGPAGSQPAATLTATIGGKTATVVSAVPAPGSLSGVVLVTLTVPSGAASGADAVVVTAGGNPSPSGVTLAVK
jgi:uncharacterized protein (TIGR03437 family)